MTTIAYRAGVLAGDTRLSDDGGLIWTDNYQKVFKLKDGSLIGFSGENEAGELIYRAAASSAEPAVLCMEFPDVGHDEEVYGILITPDGKIYMTEGRCWSRWPEEYAAIGNGKRYALTTMDNGGNAVEAVLAGIKRDCFSGGRVTSVELDEKG